MAVRLIPLGSGSSGNATLVESGPHRILVDAGLSARDLGRRLEAVGCAPASVAAVFLTHEHHDHARGVERFSKQHNVPVFCSAETLEAAELSPRHLASWHMLPLGSKVDLDGFSVEPFPVPHDAALPVGFVICTAGVRIGVVTDIGHATTLVVERLRGCHVLMIEANHDDAMLVNGPYPWPLKQRVGGRLGHLSNDEAGRLLAAAADGECRAVVLAHLSEKNNRAALARDVAARALAEVGVRKVQMRVAERKCPTPAVVL